MTKTVKILLEAQANGVQQAKSQLSSIAQVERAHARAIKDTGRERAQVERAHKQANALLAKEKSQLSPIVQVEKAHARAIAQTGKERAATERAHKQANAMLAKEKSQLSPIVQVEKAHARAIAQTGKERAATERAHKQANQLLAKEKQALQANTRQLGMYGGAMAGVVLAVGTKAVGAFTDFQASQNQVKAVTRASSDEMQRMKDLALEMGASTKFSAKEASDATSFLAMAGLNVQQVMTALPSTLKLAAAGNLDLASASDIATNVMSGMGLEAGNLGRIVDVMALSASSANTDVAQMGSAMKFVAPVASAAGLSVEETAAAIGLLSNAGIQGEMAGTSLRGMLTKLLNPSNAAAGAMERLGINVTDASGEMRPFNSIVADFEHSGLTAADAMLIFGQRAGPGMLALVSQGAGSLEGLTANLENAEGAADKMAQTQQEGLVGSMTRLGSATDTLMIKLGEQFAPTVGIVVDGIVDLVSWIQQGEGGMSAVAGVMAGVFVTGVGLAAGALWTFVPAITAATGGLNLIIPLIGLAVAGYITWKDEINAFVLSAWNPFVGALETGIDKLRPLASLIGIDLPENLNSLKSNAILAGDSVADLDSKMLRMAEAGTLSKDSMIELAQRALELRSEGENLTTGLGNILIAYGDQTTAAMEYEAEVQRLITAYDMTDEAARGMAASSNEVGSAIELVKGHVSELSDELAGHSLTTAFKEAKKKGEEFLDVVGTRFAMDMKASMESLKSIQIQMAIQSAGKNNGLDFAAAFQAGYMDGPGGLMTTVPQSMMKLSSDGSWSLAGGKGAEEWAGVAGSGKGLLGRLDSKITGGPLGKIFTGGFNQVTGLMTQFASGDWKSGLNNLVQMGLSALPPGMAQVAQLGFAAFKKAWDWFKKPSETELAARDMWSSTAGGIVSELQGVGAFSDEVAHAMSKGWEKETAEMRAAFITLGMQQGKTYDEAFGVYEQYEKAVRDADLDLMRALESNLEQWSRSFDSAASGMQRSMDGVASNVKENLDNIVEDFEDAAQEVQGGSIWPNMIEGMIEENEELTESVKKELESIKAEFERVPTVWESVAARIKEIETKFLERRLKAEIAAIEEIRDAKLDAIDEQIKAMEKQLAKELAGIEAAKKWRLDALDAAIKREKDRAAAAIAGIEAAKKWRLDALDAAIKREKDRAAAAIAEIEAAKKWKLDAIDAEIKREKDRAAAAIAGIEAEKKEKLAAIDLYITKTKKERDAAIKGINDQIAVMKRLHAEKLSAMDTSITAAEGKVADTGAISKMVDKYSLDASKAIVFQSQKASDEILRLAADLNTLQTGGLNVTAGMSEKLDEEIRAAVSAASQFGISIPESMRATVESFDDIDVSLIQFGDGLSDEVARVEQLKEQKIALEASFNESIRIAEEKRAETERSYDSMIDNANKERDLIERFYAERKRRLESSSQAVLENLYKRKEWVERYYAERKRRIESSSQAVLENLYKRKEWVERYYAERKRRLESSSQAVLANLYKRKEWVERYYAERKRRLESSHQVVLDNLYKRKQHIESYYLGLLSPLYARKAAIEAERVAAQYAILRRELALLRMLQSVSVPSTVPGLAAGGVVERGKPYIVGERAPELFIPNQSGRVEPIAQQRQGGRPRVIILQLSDGTELARQQFEDGPDVGDWLGIDRS